MKQLLKITLIDIVDLLIGYYTCMLTSQQKRLGIHISTQHHLNPLRSTSLTHIIIIIIIIIIIMIYLIFNGPYGLIKM